MSVLVSPHHVTRYTYERPVALGLQVIGCAGAAHPHASPATAEGRARRIM
jgi:hypothetical protein